MAELKLVDKIGDAEVNPEAEEADDVCIEDDELEEEGIVPLRIYNESRLPAPV